MSRAGLVLITLPVYLVLGAFSIYYTVYCFRYRLWMSESEIRVRGAFSDQTIPIAQIEQLKWQSHPNTGFVRLAGDFGKMNLELAQFTPSDRDEIVAFFRSAIEDARQVDQVPFDRRDNQSSPEALERAEKTRCMFQRIVNLVLFVAFGYVIVWFIYPWPPIAAAAAAQVLIGGILWILGRRSATQDAAMLAAAPAERT
jgi:hypothetical protein